MLILLSDVNSIMKVEASGGTLLSGAVQGSFVNVDGSAPAASGMGYQIWTESDKDASGAEAGWTPDQGATGAVTVLAGSYRAKTDQCVDASYAAGDALTINASGKLIAGTIGTDQIVAFAMGQLEDGVSFKGSSYDNVLEYITV